MGVLWVLQVDLKIVLMLWGVWGVNKLLCVTISRNNHFTLLLTFLKKFKFHHLMINF